LFAINIDNSDQIRELLTLGGPTGSARSVAWSPDGTMLAAVSGGGGKTGCLGGGCKNIALHIWDIANQKGITNYAEFEGIVDDLAWSPDGKRLAISSWDYLVHIWDTVSEQEIPVLKGHKRMVTGVAWSPDGEWIASTSCDGIARVWNATTRALKHEFTHVDNAWTVAWSPDGSVLASTDCNTVFLWDIANNGKLLKMLREHRNCVMTVDWSPDGTKLVSGGMDKTIRIWDASSGNQLIVIDAHPKWVMYVDWSPDGSMIASASADASVRIWDAASGEMLNTLEGHEDWIQQVAWSPDGTMLATAGWDNTVRLWGIPTGEETFTGDFAFTSIRKTDSTATPIADDLTYDITSGCVKIIGEGYKLNKIMSTAYGLPAQTALLSNGDIVIAEYGASTITRLGNGSYEKIVDEKFYLSPAIASLPDGRVAYAQEGNRVNLIDLVSGEITQIGVTERQLIGALATDKYGNVFAATNSGNLYKFVPDTKQEIEITNELPFEESAISDIDIAEDGTIYVAGYGQVIAFSEGSYSVVASNLNYEPVWVEIAPNGVVYINDMANGLHEYHPATNRLLKLSNIPAFGDIVALSNQEIVFYNPRGSFYRYSFDTKEIEPFFLGYGNSNAFAVSENSTAYFASANIPEVHKSILMGAKINGDITPYEEISYGNIPSADFDFDQNLCIATDQGFHCYKDGELDRSIRSSSDLERNNSMQIAIGPNGDWYLIVSNYLDSTQVYRMDETGTVTTLPIYFSLSSFSGAYKISGASIDVGDDGQLALIVSAIGSKNEGPYYQRIYRADSDGGNLTEIANLDSKRIGGMVDIAVAPDGEIFVLTVQGPGGGYYDPIYKIDNENNVHPFVEICGGHDPKSIDVDANGNLWFSTTTGIFQVVPQESE